MPEPPAYVSPIPFDVDDRLDGLMLVCSDGRFEDHVDDFRRHLAHTLGLRRLDRYFVPGAQLQFLSAEAGHPDAGPATDFWTRFLIDNHHTQKVVIIGHEQCAAYRFAPAYQTLSQGDLRQRQYSDLKKIRGVLLEKYPEIEVYLYFMCPSLDSRSVEFHNVV